MSTNTTSTWEESPLFSRVRTDDHHNLAFVAFEAARAHLEGIRAIANSNDESRSAELHLRVRAFFWEMVATWELFHNWANEHFKFGLGGRKLNPANVQKRLASDPRCTAVYDVLRSTYESSWLWEVLQYRNYAHRSYLDMQGLEYQTSGSFQTFLIPCRDGQSYVPLVEHLASYVEAIAEVGQKLDVLKSSQEK